MRTCGCWILLLLFAVAVNGRQRAHTEEEEAKKLQEIKKREYELFKLEMEQQSAQRGVKFVSSELGVQLESGSYDSADLPSELRGSSIGIKKHRHRHEHKAKAEALQSPPKVPDVAIHNFDDSDDIGEEDHWCYHCASPMDKLRPEMRKSIRNVLEMRRTAFPIDAVTSECSSARNMTKLKKQKCSYKYCQTLSILDRNAGNAFVVRGCAEYFGAINVPELEKNSDYSCNMIHEKLEIKECICKNKKYCNAGWGKRSVGRANRQSYLLWTIVVAVVVALF